MGLKDLQQDFVVERKDMELERRDESQDIVFQPLIKLITTGEGGGRMGTTFGQESGMLVGHPNVNCL